MDPSSSLVELEIEVVDILAKQAKFLRTASRGDPRKAMVAGQWEIKLGEDLQRLRAALVQPA